MEKRDLCSEFGVCDGQNDDIHESVANYIEEYAGNSTIHGVRYLGERRRPIVEKVWWITVFLLSICGCGKLIMNIYQKWDETPVIVTFGEQPTPVWKIPFPAITICPDIKAKGSVFNFTKMYLATRDVNTPQGTHLDPTNVRYLEAMSQLCFPNLNVTSERLTNLTENLSERELIESFRELAPQQSNVLLFCQFRNEPMPCTELFSEIVTELGICYNLNLLDSKDLFRGDAVLEFQRKSSEAKQAKHWSIDDGYSEQAERNSYPLRATQTGLEGNLEMYMGVRASDIDYMCRGPTPGFRVHLHSPASMPQMTKQYVFMSLEQNVFVEIQPIMMTTSDGLKNYVPERRQCYYQNERYLRFFHVYTRENCELECLSNYTQNKCGCVKFSMPHDNDDKMCGSDDTACYTQATFDFEEMIFQGNLNEFLRSCNCLQGCTSLKYRTLISQSKLEPHASLNFIKKMRLDEMDVNSSNSLSLSEVNAFRKMVKKDFHESVASHIEEYTGSATIHGIRYLGDRKRPYVEKIWWIAVFLLSIFKCAHLTLEIYDKWDRMPVIVTFGEKPTPVWEIPFPAITICPDIKTKSNVFNFTKVYHETRQMDALARAQLNSTVVRYLDAMSQVCFPNLNVTTDWASSSIKNPTEKELIDLYRELAPRQSAVLLFCQFRNKPVPCTKLFSEIVTELGICYNFNLLSPHDLFRNETLFENQRPGSDVRLTNWTIDSGYEYIHDRHEYPLRATQTGIEGNLEMYLGMREVNLDYLCRGPTPGFRVHLHSPTNLPKMTNQYVFLSSQQNIFVEIQPTMMTTSEGLKNYLPERRQCYYQGERYLRFFKFYTRENCEVECLTNYTQSTCGCVKFSMPHDNDDKMCGSADVPCYTRAIFEFGEMIFQGNLNEFLRSCNCLQGCTSLQYRTRISQSKLEPLASLNFIKKIRRDKMNMNSSNTFVSRLRLTFNENDLLTSHRSERYGMTDFIANVGGLLGLFMGVSILSLFEFIYYFTIRVMGNCRMNRKVGQTIPNNVQN